MDLGEGQRLATRQLRLQRGIYFAAGGQPGHHAAWRDATVNAASSDFFQDILTALDRA